MSAVKLTPSQRKALDLLAGGAELGAREFARLMWPDHKGWSTPCNGGRGVARGKAMWTAGGSYLTKLRDRGWVALTGREGYSLQYRITDAGREVLARDRERQPVPTPVKEKERR